MANHELTQDQFDALTGSGGPPSAVNKYVTEDDLGIVGVADTMAKLASDGSGVVDSGILVSGVGEDVLTPVAGDNSGSIGQPGTRFSAVYANDVVAGDLSLMRPGLEGEPDLIAWRVREFENRLEVQNVVTGDRYVVPLVPIGGGVVRRLALVVRWLLGW